MKIDERHAAEAFAARGMSNQDIEFGPARRAIGAIPGVLLGYGFLASAYRGDLGRSGFDIWLSYAAVALGTFIFPRTMRFAMTVVAVMSPLAVLMCLVRHHSASTVILAAAVGLSAWAVRVVIRWFRPEPFAPKWPTQ